VSCGVGVRMRQHQVLDDELDVDQAAAVVLEVEQFALVGVGVGHLLAHGDHFALERGQVARLAQHRDADGFEGAADPGVAGEKRARVSAWCSHTQADSVWYCVKASSELTSRPASPLGRRRRSVWNRVPAGVALEIQVLRRCASGVGLRAHPDDRRRRGR
jgi:hypothetical protein